MMSGHGANSILFTNNNNNNNNNNKKTLNVQKLANPPTLCPITSHFCLPPTPLKVDVTCVSPLSKNKPLLYP